ncbi:hypothetical protein CHS0354_012711 [Potamilus streckersoni]|uniref:C2H2-type domain-containing protein n=1 Tax=Potamilus streckersoni TaxID=2493646 RepID=A0AAE0W4K7_9BIVA|nr:hypothetical protein CHS0354_012711 [Potamilus streckersoni]
MKSEVILNISARKLAAKAEKEEEERKIEEERKNKETREKLSPLDFINQTVKEKLDRNDKTMTHSPTTTHIENNNAEEHIIHVPFGTSPVLPTGAQVSLPFPVSFSNSIIIHRDGLPHGSIPGVTEALTFTLPPVCLSETITTAPLLSHSILGSRVSALPEEALIQTRHGNLLSSSGLSHFHLLHSELKERAMSAGIELHDCRWMNCDQKFVSMEDLVNHVNDQHVKVERPDVDYQCKWNGCPRRGKGFNARYKMLIHIRTHTNEKPHKCNLCGKSFSRLENLKIHNRSHTGEKPYICPFDGCGKAYSNSSDRFKHVRTHQEDKPYVCKMPGCNKRYTDPSSLRKHVRTHGHYFHETSSDSKTQTNSTISISSHSSQHSIDSGFCSRMLPSPNGFHAQPMPSPIPTLPLPHPHIIPIPGGLGSGSLLSTIASSPLLNGSINSIIHMPGLTSNPLLSSALLTPVPTQTISTQTEGEIVISHHSPPPHFQRTSRNGDIVHDGASLDTDEKSQDCPLDLTTNPISPQGDASLVSPVSPHDHSGSDASTDDVTHRWELINTT